MKSVTHWAVLHFKLETALLITSQIVLYLPIFASIRWVFVAFMALVLAWFIWVSFVHLRRHALVVTYEAKDGRTFIQRNSDAIVLAAISAILGAVLGAVATKTVEGFSANEQQRQSEPGRAVQPKA